MVYNEAVSKASGTYLRIEYLKKFTNTYPKYEKSFEIASN